MAESVDTAAGLPGGPTGSAPERDRLVGGERAARLREVFSRRPTVGPGVAAKAVAEDASALIKAEIALAKAEISQGAKVKGLGAGLLVGAAVFGWLALQGLLITAGFALAAAGLAGWAAALIVSAVLLLLTGVLGLLGKRKLAAPVGVETTKANVQEDVAWTKAHLPSR